MKKKKNQSCIYWDESSRGKKHERKPGRWVGERVDNGKRVRMRSTNYDNVLQWVTGDKRACNRIQLKGMPEYSVDVDRQEVFGIRGQLLKGQTQANRPTAYYTLSPSDSEKCIISFYRLAYSALHGIDPRTIPSNMTVDYEDGEYRLMYLGDLKSNRNERCRREKRRKINATLRKRKHEIEILQRFYTTGDSAELVTYVTKGIFDNLVTHVMSRRHCLLEKATDVVLDATEQFLHRAVESDVPIISISPTIQGLCHRALKDEGRKREYNDNVIYKTL